VSVAELDTVEEQAMNEDVLNTTVRKFLKKLGVTAQREIEQAVRKAAQEGKLQPGKALPAKATVTLGSLGLTFDVDGMIEVE
jgi:Family of unknown function (DUF6494)